MILHLGGNHAIFTSKIIAIVDHDSMYSCVSNRDLFKRLQTENRIFDMSQDTSSYVFAQLNDGSVGVYCSVISSGTLAKRCNFVEKIQHDQHLRL